MKMKCGVVLRQASFLMSHNWQKHYENSTIILWYINLSPRAGGVWKIKSLQLHYELYYGNNKEKLVLKRKKTVKFFNVWILKRSSLTA